ncbi:MAG: class I SAM-dependent methyltransferase [Parcubacteria group bacterium]|nr:class I SAM-dependent methyltransferase [Parcubacteria group bacterium]
MTTHSRAPVLFALCRLLKPKTIVETGVQSGISSTYILESLERNEMGNLYSIDYPNKEFKNTTGWLIPNRLRHRWILKIGKSSDELSPLLKHLVEIDFFLHDSDHSYTNMMFEFRTSWPYIKKGGLLLSDDTHLNKAFYDFSCEVNRTPVKFYSLSVIMK